MYNTEDFSPSNIVRWLIGNARLQYVGEIAGSNPVLTTKIKSYVHNTEICMEQLLENRKKR